MRLKEQDINDLQVDAEIERRKKLARRIDQAFVGEDP